MYILTRMNTGHRRVVTAAVFMFGAMIVAITDNTYTMQTGTSRQPSMQTRMSLVTGTSTVRSEA